jgi:hypothetical protein
VGQVDGRFFDKVDRGPTYGSSAMVKLVRKRSPAVVKRENFILWGGRGWLLST